VLQPWGLFFLAQVENWNKRDTESATKFFLGEHEGDAMVERAAKCLSIFKASNPLLSALVTDIDWLFVRRAWQSVAKASTTGLKKTPSR